MSSSALRFLTVCLFFLMLCFPLCSQSPEAAIVGVVRDASGAGVPAAAIQVRNIDTNALRHLASDPEGRFTVPNLNPGYYEVMVEKTGFQSLRETGLELQVNQTARLELTLKIGSVTEAIEVTAQAPLINTEDSVKGDVIVTEEISEMPLNGRNFQDLAFLVPGVQPTGQGDTGSPFAINGARNDNTNYLIDGINARRPEFGQTQISPNLDAIQEFKMSTSGYSAEYGRLSGGVMSVALKSGTNQPHGSVFEFLRNDKFDARNFFSAQKPELRRNQFGALLDGPVFLPKLYNGHDRTFFLFSWESLRDAVGNTQLSRVPTPLERAGDFSQTLDAGPKPAVVHNPFANGAPFPGNVIPASLMSPIAAKIFPYWPLPNRADQANNFLANVSSHNPWDSFMVKLDHRLSDKDSVGFRYQHIGNHGAAPFDSSPLGLFQTVTNTITQMIGINYTRVFTPTLINEFRGGLYRTGTFQPPVDAGTNFAEQFGIAGTTSIPALMGFPKITVTGLATIGDKIDRPWVATTNDYSYSDTVTWIKGAHQVKFGGDLLRTQNFQPYYSNNRGTFNFLGNWTTEPFADFLLGVPDSASRQTQPPLNYLFSTNFGLFAQDDFKITSRLTLNLGLRWDVIGPQSDKYGRYAGFIPQFGKIIAADDRAVPDFNAVVASVNLTNLVGVARDYGVPQSLVYTRYNNLAPRLGLAWRPFGGTRTVVRGGYGIFYGASANNANTVSMANVFPFAIAQQVNRVVSNPNAISFANPFANASGATISVGGIVLDAPAQYLQSWNLTVERELGHLAAVEIGYNGSKGTHLGLSSDLNRPYYSLGSNGQTISVRPYPQFSNPINYLTFGGNSTYNAGLITLRRRFAHGMFFRVNFMHSKSIDEGSTLAGGGNGGPHQMQNPRDLHAERGRSNFDAGNSFSMNYSYDVPSRGPSGLKWLLRGWQMAGSGTARTGQAFNPILSNVNLALGGAIRPDRIAKGSLPNPTPDRWFDISAFPPVPNASFRFGTAGRNIIDGPGAMNVNFSLLKNVKIRERDRLQFRWELFNAINRANFTLPTATVNTVTAGTITSAGAGRQMQLGLKYQF